MHSSLCSECVIKRIPIVLKLYMYLIQGLLLSDCQQPVIQTTLVLDTALLLSNYQHICAHTMLICSVYATYYNYYMHILLVLKLQTSQTIIFMRFLQVCDDDVDKDWDNCLFHSSIRMYIKIASWAIFHCGYEIKGGVGMRLHEDALHIFSYIQLHS